MSLLLLFHPRATATSEPGLLEPSHVLQGGGDNGQSAAVAKDDEEALSLLRRILPAILQ